MTSNRRWRPLAWLWWNTLPYEGWTWCTEDDVACGARSCPWWAHPLAWVHRLLERCGVNPW